MKAVVKGGEEEHRKDGNSRRTKAAIVKTVETWSSEGGRVDVGGREGGEERINRRLLSRNRV
jgi:hypothetical protein